MKSPDCRVGACGSGEHVGEMCLIEEAAFSADLRERQPGARYELLGLSNALVTNPVLRGHPGAALERPGKMAS
jgi:hypothetical protein